MQATLPYRLYLEASAFAAERERIFTRRWFLVGRDEDVPDAGDWRRVAMAGEQLVLVRGEDDRLRAFANTCRHRGAELCPADGPEAGHAGRLLRCPYHHWTYGLDGRLTVLQEQVTYYAVGDPAPFAIGRLPVWIWMDEPSFYGFPLFGRPGVKSAQDCGGAPR